MRFTILNWNIGGAKVLEQNRFDRKETRKRMNDVLSRILTANVGIRRPHVVTLQEVVRYKEPNQDEPTDLIDVEKIPGYSYFPFMLLDTGKLSSRAKWRKVELTGEWPAGTYFAQGNAFLIRNDVLHLPVWDLSDLRQHRENRDHHIEPVHLDSGLYFGDRDTEPRAALVAHFVFDPTGDKVRPLDVFVVNLHLTTLTMEREGVPEIDAKASEIRMAQLKVVFNGIVSRYNSWRQDGYRERGKHRKPQNHEAFHRHAPVWILAGDFNFTEASAEYDFVRRMNFVDTVPEAGTATPFGRGTKASGFGVDPTLTLDYIFAGPQFVSLDPAIAGEFAQNVVIRDHELRASDHYPLVSSITLIPK